MQQSGTASVLHRRTGSSQPAEPVLGRERGARLGGRAGEVRTLEGAQETGSQQSAWSRGVSPPHLRFTEGETEPEPGRLVGSEPGPARGAKGQQVWLWDAEGLWGCTRVWHLSG